MTGKNLWTFSWKKRTCDLWVWKIERVTYGRRKLWCKIRIKYKRIYKVRSSFFIIFFSIFFLTYGPAFLKSLRTHIWEYWNIWIASEALILFEVNVNLYPHTNSCKMIFMFLLDLDPVFCPSAQSFQMEQNDGTGEWFTEIWHNGIICEALGLFWCWHNCYPCT